MGKAAKLNRAQRATDPHAPRDGDLVPGTLDRRTMTASVPRRANLWQEQGGRRVGCDCWSHTQDVTAERCDHCGAAVPLVTLPREEMAAFRATVAAA